MINDQIINTNELISLELAKFILSKIIKNQDTIEQMSKELDNNGRLVLRILHFFTSVGWAKRNVNGTYAITAKCKI